MSLFSFLRKNRQESASDDSAFYSRAEEETRAIRSQRKRGQARQIEQGAKAVDPVLPEKKRARRRLIGAVALVLAAVIGLPMILDSEPKPLADDIAIEIPSKDKPTTSTVSPASPSQPSKVAATAALDPKEEVIEPGSANEKLAANNAPAAALAGGKGAAADKPALAPATVKEQAQARSEDKAESRSADRSEARAEPQPESKLHDKATEAKFHDREEARLHEKMGESDDAARAKALLEGKPDPKAAEKKSSKFVIQVAALATREKVNELQTKLKDAGINSYTQKVATNAGERIRIRVGPFATKEEADRVRAKLAKLGLSGTLVPA